MKHTFRSVAYLLLITVLLPLGLFSCEKTHHFNEAWKFDETYHWHTCSDEDCEELDAKDLHLFNSGVETKAPSVEADGETTFTCTVCGYQKNVPVAKLTQEWQLIGAENRSFKKLTKKQGGRNHPH